MHFLEEKKLTSLATFIACLILSALAIIFLVYPKYKQYEANKIRLQTTTDQLQELLQKAEEAKRSFVQMENYKADLESLRLTLPVKPNPSSVYAHLEQLARQSNLSFSSLSSSEEANPPQAGKDKDATPAELGAINISFEVKGTQESLQALVRNIERSARFLEIQSIDVSGQRGDELSYKISLRTYYQKTK